MTNREYSHEFHIRIVNTGEGAYEANKKAVERLLEILRANPDVEWPQTERGYWPSRVRETLASRNRRREEAAAREREGQG